VQNGKAAYLQYRGLRVGDVPGLQAWQEPSSYHMNFLSRS